MKVAVEPLFSRMRNCLCYWYDICIVALCRRLQGTVNGEPENVKMLTKPNLNPSSVGNFILCFVPCAHYPQVTSPEISQSKFPSICVRCVGITWQWKKGFILKNTHSWNISNEKHELVNELKTACCLICFASLPFDFLYVFLGFISPAFAFFDY